MPQAILTGKSMIKVANVDASDDDAVVYKSLGDGQRLPLLWATNVTILSGTSGRVIVSGVKFGDQKACDALFVVSPVDATAAAEEYYIYKEDALNRVTLVIATGPARASITYNVYVYSAEAIDYDSADKIQIWKNP